MQAPRISGLARPKRIGQVSAFKPFSELKIEGSKKSKAGKHTEDYFSGNPRIAWPMKMDIKKFGTLKYTDDAKRQYYTMSTDPDAFNADWIASLKELHPKDAVCLWVAIGVDDNALQLPDATEPLQLTSTDGTNAKFTGTIVESNLNVYAKQRKTGFVVLSPFKAADA